MSGRVSIGLSLLLSAACGRLGFDALPEGEPGGNAGGSAGLGGGAPSGGAGARGVGGGVSAGAAGTGTDAGPNGGSGNAGGGSGDAGGGSGDAGGGCSGAGVLFCSSFELADFSDFSGGTIQSGALTQVVSGQPASHKGSASLQAATNGGGGGLAFLYRDLPPITGGPLYARAYFYVPGALTVTHFDVLRLMGAGASDYIAVTFSRGALSLDVATAGVSTSVTPVPRDAWFCVGLNLVVDPAQGRAELVLSDAPLAAIGSVRTLPSGGYDRLAIGLPFVGNPQPAINLRVDDVIVSTTPVMCP